MAPSEGQPSESKDDRIIRVAAYRRQDQYVNMERLANFVNQPPGPILRKIVNVPAAITSSPLSSGPVAPLGILQCLPPEIILEICKHMDVSSFLKFRQACRSSRMTTSDWHEFQGVVQNATDCFISVVRTGIATWITFPQLYRAMCLVYCERCQTIGNFIYLPTATRCCKRCLLIDPEFRIVTLNSFARAARLNVRNVSRAVNGFQCVKGDYRQLNLINFAEATKALGTAQNLDTGRGFGGLNQNPYIRLMAAAPLPLFDHKTRTTVEAFSCKGCGRQFSSAVASYHGRTALHIVFPVLFREASREHLRSDFLCHFRSCAPAIQLWEASKEGSLSIAQLETEYITSGGRRI